MSARNRYTIAAVSFLVATACSDPIFPDPIVSAASLAPAVSIEMPSDFTGSMERGLLWDISTGSTTDASWCPVDVILSTSSQLRNLDAVVTNSDGDTARFLPWTGSVGELSSARAITHIAPATTVTLSVTDTLTGASAAATWNCQP